MTSKQILLYGSSGHGLVVADVVISMGARVAGFLDDAPGLRGTSIEGIPVLGGVEALRDLLSSGNVECLVTIGDCRVRLTVAERVASIGCQLAVAVHPRATIASSVRIGAGTVVMAGAVINPHAVVGANVIINTGATVDHHCVIHDGAHVSPGANLAGNVTVGRGSHVGAGAVAIPGITIGDNCTVGAGAVVIRDVAPGLTVVGNPAREIRRKRAESTRHE
jgi:sugar O-acyltransferase (sialic acid O-acetyltransferase NeuD family)